MEDNLPRGNAEYINRLNKIKVLKLIHQEDSISRADIVKRTGISAPTVTRIVDSLINKERLAVQVGIGESSGGRPPMIVEFNGSDNYVIGVDWGRTHIYGVLSNLNAESIIELDIPINSYSDFENDLQKLKKLIAHLIENSKIDTSKLLGIGVAAAGYINKKTGIVEFSPNFNWENVDLATPLEEAFGVTVLVDNVSRVVALGELWYGIGVNLSSFILINLGYGIGAGIIVDRKAFLGFDGMSGEFGHTKAVMSAPENRKCVCGKLDCLESYSSGRGIAESARKDIHKHPESVIHILSNGDTKKISARVVAEAASAGDVYAIEVLENAATILGISIANMCNILNPEAIVLAGKVAHAGDVFFGKVQEVFRNEILRNTQRPVRLELTSLGDRGVVIGATSLILKEVLELQVV